MDKELTIEQPYSRLEEARKIIAGSREGIEKEFTRSANDWLSCASSRIFQLECLLMTEKAEQEIGPETYKQISVKLELLKTRLAELKEIYSNKEPQPPQKTKEEILRSILFVLSP